MLMYLAKIKHFSRQLMHMLINAFRTKTLPYLTKVNFLHLIILCAILLSCRKQEDVYPHELVSAFEPQIYHRLAKKLINSETCLLDSTFYFYNLSSGGKGVNHHWDFGDGTASEAFSPTHKYRNSGKYTVTLTVSLNSGKSSVYEKEIAVLAGQKRISLGYPMSTGIVELVETDDDQFTLFGWSKDLGDFPSPESALMIVLDRDLRKISQVNFSRDYRFGSASAANDGNFIVCGTTAGHELNNELLKINRQGTVLWSKKIDADINLNHTLPIANGYLLTGTKRDQRGKWQLVNVQTDLNGNVVRKQTYNHMVTLEQPGNTIQDGENYIVGGLKRVDPNLCNNCDSLSLIKFNAAGLVVNKLTIPMRSSTQDNSKVYISKLNGGGYVVAASGASALYTFTPDFKPLLQTTASGEITHLTATPNGQIVILHQSHNNGFSASYAGLDYSGSRLWSNTFNGTEEIPEGERCCTNSWAVKNYPLKKAELYLL